MNWPDFVNRQLRLHGMSSMYLTATVDHTLIDTVEGPQALADR